MQQLAFMDIELDKETRRKAEKLLSSYRNLDAIIKTQELEIAPKMTINYEPSESQRGNQFYSDTEQVVMLRERVDFNKLTKEKLHRIYNSLKPIQRQIWDLRYCDGMTDSYVYNELELTDRAYYRLKREMIAIVAEAFCLS
ncbi:hypothetical protein HXA31_20505 [Salipaludibacillus agaradhaerens]|jgi:ArpU family phage transcriptional regulator|uniref:ArpU family transcriptional regulator n=1 Tax=Salipaludibacillus agaradhaerens TaxID=76935 RepID=A0A9Q4FXR4_SALAG|nr:ArpU family phage packaging/lysis transcriptional regulator [Salipaludibacillus agaradhaerens]MCR6096870.1 hypothetical protein [Salipaludibacillus agaradhaerens]MCR6116714.1 hypothetical protein [Salipaludibacillus agaradhaerens]